MTNREAQIFQWITENPMISQDELAAKAGIARSSAAVHISNLMKKGYILGKGYVTNGPSYCTIIGSANIDIGGTPEEALREGDSNSGKAMQSLGGAGRNVAHNLRLLGVGVKLITAIGADVNARSIIESCEALGIDITNSLKTSSEATPISLYIADEKGNIKFSVSDMRIYDKLTIKFISSKMELINKSRMVILDTNIPAGTIQYLCEKCRTPIFASAESRKRAEKLLLVLDKLCVVVANEAEAEVLSGIRIQDKDTLERAADIILEKGVRNVFILPEKGGVYCACDEEQFMINNVGREYVHCNGVDDAFMAGVVLGYMKHLSMRQMAKLGLETSNITSEGKMAVNPQLCVAALVERTKIIIE